MKNKVKSYPVAPDSVYVWRGFMSAQKSYAEFVNFLGSIFVPACALLQPKVGLRAYLPTLVPQDNKPPAVPDQTALMFWDTPQSHDLANSTLAVRIYQNLHGDLYDMNRSKLPEVPVKLPPDSNQFTAEQPYYLFDNAADWMLGNTQHLVASRPATLDVNSFQTSVYKWSLDFQHTAKDIDGALVCCGNDYVAVWVHSSNADSNLSPVFSKMNSFLQVQTDIAPVSYIIREDLWNKWAGIDLTQAENASLNIQLDRPHNTIPQSK